MLTQHTFMLILKKRRACNRIYRLKDNRGEWVKDQERLEHAFIEFYENLLGASQNVRKVSNTIIAEGVMLNEDNSRCCVCI